VVFVTDASLQAVTEIGDQEVVTRVLAGETMLYEILMRRYNQRIYRVARAILRDDGEAEDVMQDAYVRAYRNLSNFEGRSSFVTWLTRIAVNEALQRRKKVSRMDQIEDDDHIMKLAALGDSPEQSYGRQEITSILEKAVAALPEQYRIVFMLREIEEMTTEETAAALELSEENIRIRLHRARLLLRKFLEEKVGLAARHAYSFHLNRCDRVVANVFAEIRETTGSGV
jgi:RNA polymerase sigma-70 factor, ECF subfamily